MIWAILGATHLSLSVRMIDLVAIIWLADQHDIVSHCNINGAAGGRVLNGRTVS